MRTSRKTFLLIMLSSLCCFALQPQTRAQRTASTLPEGDTSGLSRAAVVRPRDGGIVELVPARYLERYQGWKNDLLSTETGRSQWEAYDRNARFSLTILVSDDDRHGAGTSKYKWDDAGELVAATITLGSRIDEGYPNPIYYPVMYSLSPLAESFTINSNVLAAAKIAHELGHVRQATSTGGTFYRLQNQLMLVYNQILLSNGRNTRDPRLLELERRMGGTPVEIWESREYWGEVNAMLYLRQRITDHAEQRALFSRVRRTVELYAKDYADRFEQVTQ